MDILYASGLLLNNPYWSVNHNLPLESCYGQLSRHNNGFYKKNVSQYMLLNLNDNLILKGSCTHWQHNVMHQNNTFIT